MIERSLLVENVDAVLVTVDRKGNVRWLSAPTESLREVMDHLGQPPNLHWYRVSDDMSRVYPAANGTPEYRPAFSDIPWSRVENTGARHVRNFVKNLRKTPANA